MTVSAVHQPGVTFAVDKVSPATEPLPECRTHEAVKRMLGGAIESCSDYCGTVVKDVPYQPLLAAVYTAFSRHRPLVLAPDAVWITIAQSVAHHMAIHGERLRSSRGLRLVLIGASRKKISGIWMKTSGFGGERMVITSLPSNASFRK